jgi:hypothetical protein
LVAEYKLEIGEIVKRNAKGGGLGDRKGEMTEAQTLLEMDDASTSLRLP